jgi:hypothetical protein
MAEIFFTFFLFIAITFVTAALFGVWVIVSIFRVVGTGLSTVFGGSTKSRPIMMNNPVMRTCTNPRCKVQNPADAHFCRRCGQNLPQAQRVAVRRAAMW